MQIIVDTPDVMLDHGIADAGRAQLADLAPLMLSFSADAFRGLIRYLTIGLLALIVPITAALTFGLLARPHPATVA